MDHSSSASSASASASGFRSVEGSTDEIPIIYFSTHGVFDVFTDDKKTEIDKTFLGLATEIPKDMTILKFNFVPINICNYGGSGTIELENVANRIHHLISTQLRPEIIMARHGFEYFLHEDPETIAFISSSGLIDSLEKYRDSAFINVPGQFYEVLYHVAKSHGLRQETILDEIMNELNDCEVNDTTTSNSELTGIEAESVMRGNNVMSGNNMMIQIINECVKIAVKPIKAEVIQHFNECSKDLKNLREKDLYPRLKGIPEYETRYADITATFNETPQVKGLIQSIQHATAYINHVDDLENNWNISIPNKSHKSRYILNKTFSLFGHNTPNGMDWNITMFRPKTGDVVDILGLKPENQMPGGLRRITTSEILEYLQSIGVKTVILLDETCSTLREITHNGSRRNVEERLSNRWAIQIKKLNANGFAIYGGKRKKNKNRKITKTKNQKTKNKKQKTKKTKIKKYTNI